MTKRILIVLAATSLTTAIAQTSDNSFVGKWKMNPEKSQMTGLTYKIEDAGNDTYRLIFGDRAPETIPADGTDHKTQYGSTWAIKKMGANTWKFTQKRNGKVTSESTWTVSDDGQTFTSKAKIMRPDGSTSNNDLTMKRTDGSGSGLAATWESTEQKIGSPTTIHISKWENDGYSLTDPAFKEHLKFKTDGKDYADEGPRVPKGETVSAKQVDDHNVELTYKLHDKTLETDRWELSADGKTLTSTVNYPGQSKQQVDVFERE